MKGAEEVILALIIAVTYYSCSSKIESNDVHTISEIESNAIQIKEHPASCFQVQKDGILDSRMSFNLEKLINYRELHTKYAGWGADQIDRWIGVIVNFKDIILKSMKQTCLYIKASMARAKYRSLKA